MSALNDARASDNFETQRSELGTGSLVAAPGELIATRRTLPHEVARIGSQASAAHLAQPEDASGLLRIVEEQAHDLVKLRRALAGAMILADSRLEVIRACSFPDPGTIQNELNRVHRVLDKVLRSRWWKIGRKLRISKRISWKSAGGRSQFVAKKYGGAASDEFAAPTRIETSLPGQKSGYASFVEYATRRFLEECRSFGADVIFDVGANAGQFAQSVRECGYRGQLVSFEPLSAAHADLIKVAADDPLWDIVDRCAVGAEPGDAQIHIAGNSASSSLFPMLDRHKEAAPESVYNGVEACRVITLDDYIDSTFSDPTTTFGLKIDTQGYEAEVLAGLKRNIERIDVVLCEMSLAPLYEGGPTISELSRVLADLGYRCVALGPEFEDPRTGELLQVNGIFVRR